MKRTFLIREVDRTTTFITWAVEAESVAEARRMWENGDMDTEHMVEEEESITENYIESIEVEGT